MARHIAVVARVKKAAANKVEVLSENQVLGNHGLKPDLVLKKGPNVFILDITVPFDNRVTAFETAADEKVRKYEEVRAELATQHEATATVVPIIVGSLGAWDPMMDSYI